ncbi:integrator complex subunit 6-like isoform X2 [Oppia nitens]|nr:integrator complex subunit 6-like isoform X2 [Oppia nitens]
MASIDQLIQRIHSGVVIHFEKVGPDPPVIIPADEDMTTTNTNNTCDSNNGLIINSTNNTTNKTIVINSNINNNINNDKLWHSCRKLIYVQRSAQKGYSVGHWPIPESFWPDISCPTLQPRTAQPIVKFTCTDSEPTVIENLPFDKYELEQSPLTQFILSRKQPHVAWQVFVSNSHKNTELGLPFGYLKASTNLTCVNLFVLPYNYPILLPLLDDLFKQHQGKPTREWKVQFDNYLKLMPLYYAAPLKRALQRMGAPNLVPDQMENCLSYPVLNYLKKLKNLAKAEYEKLVASVGTGKPQQLDSIRVNCSNMRRIADRGLCSNPLLSKRFEKLKEEMNEFSGFGIRFRDKYLTESKIQCYRNAFDINRQDLLDQICRMRTNFMQRHTSAIKYQDDDQLHSLPISQMGNYQEYLKRMPVPLRELESTPVRQHMFGNPFKIDKKGMMMIDETDIDLVGQSSSGGQSPARSAKRSANDMYSGPKPKRKPGPLPKDFPLTRPLSPIPITPPPSPTIQSPPVSPSLPLFIPSTPPSTLLPPPPTTSSLASLPPTSSSLIHDKSVANGSLVSCRLTPKDNHTNQTTLTTTSTAIPSVMTTNTEHNITTIKSSIIVTTPKTSATDHSVIHSSSTLSSSSSSAIQNSLLHTKLDPQTPDHHSIQINNNNNNNNYLPEPEIQVIQQHLRSNSNNNNNNNETNHSKTDNLIHNLNNSNNNNLNDVIVINNNNNTNKTKRSNSNDNNNSSSNNNNNISTVKVNSNSILPLSPLKSSTPIVPVNGSLVVPPVVITTGSTNPISIDTENDDLMINHCDHNGTAAAVITATAANDDDDDDTDDDIVNNIKMIAFTADECELKKYLFKLVRKPGRNFDELLLQLSHTRGSVREHLIQEVIQEANRFKRKSLIDILSNQFKSKTTTTSSHELLSNNFETI